jgi:hypothetical protein
MEKNELRVGNVVSEDIRYNAQGLHFRNIKYVHQIQNAYFTLTGGEELDINNLLK